ncbi:MAG: TatD family hydrolase [Lentisphaerae bacterium]|nr:TatD family hydrolase [Lentisphaerota bacterium]
MDLFDSHMHVENPDALAGMLERARAAGVAGMLAVGGTEALNAAALEAARRYPEAVRAAVGWDREAAGQAGRAAALERLLAAAGAAAAAVGEIGLDFHYAPERAEAQAALFRAQLEVARAHGLPVVVHSREAEAATRAALEAHAAAWTGPSERLGVLHCFTGSADFARACVDLGFFISFSGIVTFRKADALRRTAAAVPDDRLLIETDTPYCTPEPHRGKRNEPAYLVHTAARLAELRGTDPRTLAALTAANARRLFQAAAV